MSLVTIIKKNYVYFIYSMNTYCRVEVRARMSSSCRTSSTDSPREILMCNRNVNRALLKRYCMLSADESYIGSMLNSISPDLNTENNVVYTLWIIMLYRYGTSLIIGRDSRPALDFADIGKKNKIRVNAKSRWIKPNEHRYSQRVHAGI